MIALFFEVPPHAQYVLSFVARSGRSTLFPSMPSTMVAGFPHFRISIRTFTVCCSMLMVPQTQRSLGRPQVEQTSAMLEAQFSLVIVHDESITACVFKRAFRNDGLDAKIQEEEEPEQPSHPKSKNYSSLFCHAFSYVPCIFA